MTREEEIKKEAQRVSYNGDEFSSFILGAEWADETMIDKACEWLDKVDTDGYMDSGIFQMSVLIADLKEELKENKMNEESKTESLIDGDFSCETTEDLYEPSDDELLYPSRHYQYFTEEEL